MWPFFGLLTLVVACFHLGRKRWQGVAWRGVSSTVHPRRRRDGEPTPEPIAFQFGVGKRNPKDVELAVSTHTSLDFSCKPESWLDRFFKWTGLTVEQQLGIDELDRAVYLVSDDPRVLDALKGNARACELLKALFCGRPHPDYTAVRLVCQGGLLRLALREASHLPGRSYEMNNQVVPMLRELADLLPRTLPAANRRNDALSLRAILVLTLSSGLALTGLMHLFRLMTFPGAITVSPVQLVLVSLPIGAGLFALLVVAATTLLARSSRLHLVLLEVCLVGSFGAFASGLVAARDLNMSLDRSPASTREAQVLDRSISRSRRGGTRYYLVLSEWPVEGQRKARVSYSTYSRTREGDTVALRMREGWLGLPWIESITPVAGRRER
jgi:hypothetical protein